MRKFFVIMLVVSWLLLLPCAAKASVYIEPDPEPPESMEGIYTIDGVIYRITGEDTVEVGYDAPQAVDKKITALVIPQQVSIENRDYRVTAIGSYAFAYCNELRKVVLPEGITSIGEKAFRYCGVLHQIDLPQSLQEMGEGAFENSGLREITVPGSLKLIPKNCFSGCSDLRTVVLEEGVERLGIQAFSSCDLEEIILPESLITIGSYAFAYGDCGERLVLPKGIKNLADYAFADSSFREIILPEGLEHIGPEAMASSNVTKLEIPSTVTEIGGLAFRYCYSLGSIYIPDSVTKLGQYIFSDTDIQTVYTSHSSQSWGWLIKDQRNFDKSIQLVYNCDSFPEDAWEGEVFQHEGVTYTITLLPEGNKPGEVQVGVGGYGNRAVGEGVEEVEIPEWIRYKGQDYQVTAVAAEGLLPLKKVKLPDSIRVLGERSLEAMDMSEFELPEKLEIIEKGAFWGSQFTEIVLPPDLKYIGEKAFEPFQDCHAEQLIIPEKVEFIGDHAFSGYNAHTFSKISLPASLIYLGEGAFSSRGLEKITLAEGNPVLYLEDGVLFTRTQEGVVLLNYPSGKEGSEYTVPEGVTAIGDRAFEGCRLTKVTLPEGVTRIGEEAFRDSFLEEIVLSEGITWIGDEAFYGCTALTKLNIPASVEAIGFQAFSRTGAHLRINTTHTRKSWTALVNRGDKGLLYQTLIVGEPFWFIWKPIGLCLFGIGSCLILVASGIQMRKRKKSMEEQSHD